MIQDPQSPEVHDGRFYFDPKNDQVLELSRENEDGSTTFSVFTCEERGKTVTLSQQGREDMVGIDRLTATFIKRFQRLGIIPGTVIESTRSDTRRAVETIVRDTRGIPTSVQMKILSTSTSGPHKPEFSIAEIINGDRQATFRIVPTFDQVFRWAKL